MKALCWYGKNDVRVERVPDPKINDPRDATIKVTSTAICGSDLDAVTCLPEITLYDKTGLFDLQLIT